MSMANAGCMGGFEAQQSLGVANFNSLGCDPGSKYSGCGDAEVPGTLDKETQVELRNFNSECLDPNEVAGPEDVTDVFLMAGQSNALGEGTVSSPILDAPNNHVLVWTSAGRWEVANLQTSIWYRNFHPGVNDSNDPAFQVAISIVEKDPCRVVAFIPTSFPGAPISEWFVPGVPNGPDYYLSVEDTATRALASLPNKNQVDMITWIQGESDDGRTNYFNDLQSLINQFRGESWVDESGLFVASQLRPTLNTVNEQIAMLANDGDDTTDFTTNLGITTHDGSHFDANSIRMVGDRLAEKYIQFTN